MTVCSAVAIDVIRENVLQLCDLLDVALTSFRSRTHDDPEESVIRAARRLADDILGDADSVYPHGATGDESQDAWADVKTTLCRPAVRQGLASIRVDYTTGSLTLHHSDGEVTVIGFHVPVQAQAAAREATAGEPEGNLPAGPLEPVGELHAA